MVSQGIQKYEFKVNLQVLCRVFLLILSESVALKLLRTGTRPEGSQTRNEPDDVTQEVMNAMVPDCATGRPGWRSARR